MNLAGTAVIFFAVVNVVKVVPYFFLGQFSTANLATSATLVPLAALAALMGVWLVKVVPRDTFYRVTYVVVFVVALKLIWDGTVGVFGL